MLVIREPLPQNECTRNFTNKPEIRFQTILDKLSQNEDNFIIENNDFLTVDELKQLNIHDNNMIDFLQNCFNSWSEYNLSCETDTTFGNKINGLVPYNLSNNKLSLSKLNTFRQIGIWSTDLITPIFENSFEQALSSVSNSYVASKYIKQGNNKIYCLNINPGHHAKSDKYGGYCYLNNAGICAKSLLCDSDLKFNKVAILDLDYHAGDGTSEIFNSDQNVLTISIHINPKYDYPFYSGYEFENTDTNYNFTFEPNCSVNDYLNLVEQSMKKIMNFNPDALIIAFGGDTYKNDLDAIETNRTQIDIDDYKKISEKIMSYISLSKSNKSIPIIITQEGGYNMEKIGDIVESFLSGFV
jgi:acetoin utilization deacetylase AcuC-like enzyme